MKLQGYLGKTRPSNSSMNPVRNMVRQPRDCCKPKGGLWTSSVETVGSGYTSDWIRHRNRTDWNLYDSEDLFVLEPSNSANVYTIDTESDLMFLADNHWREGANYHDVAPTEEVYIDFESMCSAGYDAVHVTRSSYDLLDGWDCESTVWFNWCFSSVQKIDQSEIAIDI